MHNLSKIIKPYNKIASLGCGGGLWEVMLSFELDCVEIHLQDINQALLNETEHSNTIQYFEHQFGRPTTCTFKIIIGASTKTNLPTHYFDKVLLINSFHEFDNQAEMLAECQKILKPNGQLIVEEQLAQYPGELHAGCGKRLFLEHELIQKLSVFELIDKAIDHNIITLQLVVG